MNIDLIVKNATIVTCDRDHTVVENAAIVVSGSLIQRICGDDDIKPDEISSARVIDAEGNILMPGLINMHAHCADTLFRGLVENQPLEEWLQQVWKAQAIILADPLNCRLGAELGIAELLRGGTTSIMDNYWNPDQTFEVAIDAGIRMASGEIFFDAAGMDGFNSEHRPARAREMFDRFADTDRLFVGTMPHGTYTAGPENIKTALDITRQNNGFFSIHAAETKFEQQTIQQCYKTSVIRHLDKLNALSPNSVLAHCVHVDEQEIELIAASGTHVVHNPLSNLKLASGFAPVPQMLEIGINVTLGTDGAISGNDMDMWLAMRLSATIHKAANDDPAAISSRQALHMATLNGARALGAEDQLGSLEAGKQADFILVGLSGPHAMPIFDPINHLVYSASKNDVSDVFISGRQIIDNGKFLTMDINSIKTRISRLQPMIVSALQG